MNDQRAIPAESESDTNLSPARRAWAARSLDQAAQALLAEDERHFLRQAVSTPCLNAIVKAEGIWLEDTAGRRVHGFPRQQRPPHRLRPSAAQARDRRADGGAAVHAAALHVGAGRGARPQARRNRARRSLEGAVHHRRLGRDRGRDQDRAGRDRPLQDAVVLGRLPRRRFRRLGGGRARRCSGRAPMGR